MIVVVGDLGERSEGRCRVWVTGGGVDKNGG